MEILSLTILFLVSAVIVVPLSSRLNLGSVLGYLIAGILIGPSALKLVSDTEKIFTFSEFGVIFLMFVIGLELQPSRLWILRRSVFGLGAAQVVGTTALIFFVAQAFQLPWQTSLILGFGFSLSSTALVLQSLAERHQLGSQHGRDSFSILLFQDLAVIPVLALLPALSMKGSEGQFQISSVLLPVTVITVFVVGGRLLLRPAFKWIASIKNRELFTAASLLIVVGTGSLMHSVGLSMGLGAFLAGVLLSDSEYRHELEADIEPFKGLLLGLFFMSIGMSARIDLIWQDPVQIFALVAGLFAIKAAVILVIKHFLKAHRSDSRKLAIFISQGGEFAFVLFAAAVAAGVLEKSISETMVIVVTLSMLLAPLLFVLEDKFFARKLSQESKPDFDKDFDESPVIIAGFGRFGQIVGRLLSIRKIKFTALDKSSAHVDFVRRFGNKIFYGDATRLELLKAAKAESAKLFVLAIDDVEDSLRTAEVVRRHYPDLPIYARARNRFHCYKLMDLGVQVFYRETFQSSLEMGRKVLEFLGMDSTLAHQMIERFTEYDLDLLQKQHAIYQNEAQLIQTSRQALSDLENLFEMDAKARAEQSDGSQKG